MISCLMLLIDFYYQNCSTTFVYLATSLIFIRNFSMSSLPLLAYSHFLTQKPFLLAILEDLVCVIIWRLDTQGCSGSLKILISSLALIVSFIIRKLYGLEVLWFIDLSIYFVFSAVYHFLGLRQLYTLNRT